MTDVQGIDELNVVDVPPNAVIVIRTSGLNDNSVLRHLAERFGELGRMDVTVVALPYDSDLSSLDVAAMREMGWIRDPSRTGEDT